MHPVTPRLNDQHRRPPSYPQPTFVFPLPTTASPHVLAPLDSRALPRRASVSTPYPQESRTAARRRVPRAAATPPQQLSPRKDPHAPENYGFIHVATITAAHGVAGHVKATAATDFPAHRLCASDVDRFLLLPGRRYPRPVNLLSARPASQPTVWILQLEGVTAREEIVEMRLRGARLFVRQVDKPSLSRGEYVVSDVVDCRVALRDDSASHYIAETRRGRIIADLPIGCVESVITREQVAQASGSKVARTVGNDLIEVALFSHPDLALDRPFKRDIPDDATRVLVPFVKQIVPVVDLTASIVVLDPPPGLLDIATVNDARPQRPPRALLMPVRDANNPKPRKGPTRKL